MSHRDQIARVAAYTQEVLFDLGCKDADYARILATSFAASVQPRLARAWRSEAAAVRNGDVPLPQEHQTELEWMDA